MSAARNAGDRLRREQEERHHELREVVGHDLHLVRAPGRWWKNQLNGFGIGWVSWW